MSLTSKMVLGLACSSTIGIICYVHFKQQIDRDRLHDGVIKDVERQQRRKAENLYTLQQQIDFTKQMKNSQADSSR